MSVTPAPGRRPLTGRAGFWSRAKQLLGIGSAGDWVFKNVCAACALLVIALVLLIVVLLSVEAWPAIRRLGWSLLTSTVWKTNPDNPDDPADFGQLGGLTFIYGSVVTSILALLVAVPLGVGTAAFLAEIAHGWIKRAGSFLVELLAAIPSVVYGFWGINVLAPQVQWVFDRLGGPNVGGKSLVSASLILAVMIVPYITAVSYDACMAVPRSQREGAFALGTTRWQTIWRVVLPYARPGIVGGCFLALGRAIGETMAVTMLIGNVTRIEPLPFGKGSTIPSVIAQELPNAQTAMHRSALIELGLLLFVVTMLMSVAARGLIWRMGRQGRGLPWWGRLLGRHRVPAASAAAEGGGAVALEGAPEASTTGVAKGLGGNTRWARRVDRAMTGLLALCLVVTCGPLFLIFGYITVRGIGALDLNFFVNLPRPQGPEFTAGGLANGLVGSGIIVGLASLFALPIGLLAAIFLAEYRTSKLTSLVRFFGELLGGVPSIVIGTFVYALVRWFIKNDYISPRSQFSGWAGAFALAVMMLPIVVRAAEEAIKMVPQSLRNASHALGAFHWQTVLRVCVPAALPAIITAAFLAIARIAGETAPLLLTIFGSDQMVLSPSQKMGALPLYIYNYSLSGYGPKEEKAWAAALVLLAFVMLLNVGVRIATGKRVVLASRAE
jgi:phosphate transport system permease protein